MASNRHPDRELIEAIGREVLRQQFSLSHQRLHAWTVRGVPYTHRAAVANLATLRNCPVPASFLLPPAETQAAA